MSPELVAGNPTCGNLGFTELIKIEAVVNTGIHGVINITAATATTLSFATTPIRRKAVCAMSRTVVMSTPYSWRRGHYSAA